MILAHFIGSHWLDLLLGIALFFLLTLRFIPPQMAGLEKTYWDLNLQQWRGNRKQSALEAITSALGFTLLRSLLVTITFKGATTLLMFGVVIVELVSRHTITSNAVIISIAGIIALHFESIIEQADEVSI